MTEQTTRGGVAVRRQLTQEGTHPYEEIEWERREALIPSPEDPDHPVFHQPDVEFPASWSDSATTIVAQKYFRGNLGAPERERSVRQMVDRVASTIAEWGGEEGYFASHEDAAAFEAELTYILVNQYAAFNSPVWFNVGWRAEPTCSACFILGVEDTMPSILEWNTQEGLIFQGGAGAGTNLSRIRGAGERLSKGGTGSGPVSFMRGADSWAGSIKSGGGTRRAAKLVCLDDDHPDILEFVRCKAREEEKALALREAGFDMSFDGEGFSSIQFQNANNSVRVSDAFMEALERDEQWELRERTTGEAARSLPARELMREIAAAAWRCADPGLQFDGACNRWHTLLESGRQRSSNPCGEFLSVDDSACNLASLNLMKFRREDGSFDVERFEHVVDVVFLAQDITISRAAFPTERIERNARAQRQIGIGYSNLGALLMANGVPYDSEEGRAQAAAITALLTGRAYRQSAILAAGVGPYEDYALNRTAHDRVMGMHRDAVSGLSEAAYAEVAAAAGRAWDDVVEFGERHGYRNAQASVLAPAGTISFLMDCDTTGVEPGFSLVAYKNLAGGGRMTIANRLVSTALRGLGYGEEEARLIEAYVAEEVDKGGYRAPRSSVVGAPGLREEHVAVFDQAIGERAIGPQGHLKMMAAVQPFISGALSKTLNVAHEASVEDVESIYREAWRLGLKGVALYRDGSKTVQALETGARRSEGRSADVEAAYAEGRAAGLAEQAPRRRRMPVTRSSLTHKFSLAGHEGYITAGKYDDGTLGEVFLTDFGKEGSTLRGMMGAFATVLSIGIQYGVPVEVVVRKLSYMRFEPEGMTENPEIRNARSIPDYIARWLASQFLGADACEELGVMTKEVRERQAAALDAQYAAAPVPAREDSGAVETLGPQTGTLGATDHRQARTGGAAEGPICPVDGSIMWRTGACVTCPTCGHNTGCG